MVDEATRIRVVIAITGMNKQDFAKRIGVIPTTVTNWTKGYSGLSAYHREAIQSLCAEFGISLRSDGYPLWEGKP